MSSQITETEWIWRNGEWIRWQDATLHVLSHSVQFGGSFFEGIRCYDTPDGPAIFRLEDHLHRLRDSCRLYRTELPHSEDELVSACRELIRRNSVRECYLRPMVVRGYGAAGMVPTASPLDVYLVCWPWGAYLGPEALEQGVDVCVSSWNRAEPNTYPASAKAAGNYLNSQLAKLEALTNGYTEAIQLAPSGVVSEGSGQNLFLVRNGTLLTPAQDGTLLAGITRNSVISLAQEMDIPVREQTIPRDLLYAADELFFTGTASEVTPIRSVDRITIGQGSAGPITRRLQQRFLNVVRGQAPDPHGWLTHVEVREEAVAR